MTTTTYQQWEDQLNNLGIFSGIEELIQHVAVAPAASNHNETDTINLVKKVIETRSSGGDITNIL
jgi:hypothetical protein